MTPTTTAEQVFLDFSAKKLRMLTSRIELCLDKLTDEQMWLRGAENTNSIGNLCLHLAGNLRQWIGHGIAGKPDIRVRDREFTARGQISKAELQERLKLAVAEAVAILESDPAPDLLRLTQVQKYDVTVLEAIYHVVEHFSQHTGQIIFATKALTGEDLGFYRHLSARVAQAPPTGQGQP